MSTITFRIDEYEKKLIQEFARFNGLSMSEYVKLAVMEKIEDEHDYVLAEERSSNFKKSNEKAVSIDDALKALGL